MTYNFIINKLRSIYSLKYLGHFSDFLFMIVCWKDYYGLADMQPGKMIQQFSKLMKCHLSQALQVWLCFHAIICDGVIAGLQAYGQA